MRLKRFYSLFTVTVLCCLFFACGPIGIMFTDFHPIPVESSKSESAISPSPPPPISPAPLPPTTTALIANADPTFTTTPRGQVRLAVISDLNSAYGSTSYEPEIDKALNLLPFWQPDLVICAGDMVAGQSPSLTPEQIRAMWAAFDRHITTPLRQQGLPFGFTVGNHDASGARGSGGQFLFQTERDLASEYWQDPAHDPGIDFVDRADFPFYYTFKHQDIFFLVWDGSTSKLPAEKLAWVETALSSAVAQQAKMRILLGHLPLYGVTEGRNQPGEVMDQADSLRTLLEKHHVHTYISGHQHAYYPAHRGNLQLLHSGLLGSGARVLIDSNLPPQKNLTLVDINFDDPALTTYTTYNMQTLALVAPDQLPRYLVAHNGLLLRRDVAWQDLQPAEKVACEQRLGASLCGA